MSLTPTPLRAAPPPTRSTLSYSLAGAAAGFSLGALLIALGSAYTQDPELLMATWIFLGLGLVCLVASKVAP